MSSETCLESLVLPLPLTSELLVPLRDQDVWKLQACRENVYEFPCKGYSQILEGALQAQPLGQPAQPGSQSWAPSPPTPAAGVRVNREPVQG